MQRKNAIGIDAGATLWKLCRLNKEVETEVVPADSLEHVQQSVAQWAPTAVGVTGVKAAAVAGKFGSVPCSKLNEVAAWALGAPVIAGRQSLRLPRHYLLVSIGTGTSILEVKDGEPERVSGSTLGGGTLLGLSKLLGCGDSFSDFLAAAAHGERSRVDLLVLDAVSSMDDAALRSEATASSFGRLDSQDPADLAHALTWLIGENIGILCNAVARQVATHTIVFGGSTVAGNQILQRVLSETITAERGEALFLRDGAFCGAAGAAMFAGNDHL